MTFLITCNTRSRKKKLDEDELKQIISEVKVEKISGINVTVPFKKSVIQFMDELSPEANESQSVNTIYSQNGKLIGHNTDISGFELGIKYSKYDVKNMSVRYGWSQSLAKALTDLWSFLNVSEVR